MDVSCELVEDKPFALKTPAPAKKAPTAQVDVKKSGAKGSAVARKSTAIDELDWHKLVEEDRLAREEAAREAAARKQAKSAGTGRSGVPRPNHSEGQTDEERIANFQVYKEKAKAVRKRYFFPTKSIYI